MSLIIYTGGSSWRKQASNQALPASGWRVHEFVPAVGYDGALAVRAEGPLEVVQHPLVNAGLLIP